MPSRCRCSLASISGEYRCSGTAKYCKGARSSHTRHRSPTVLLSRELSKYNAENKENISPKARSTRVSKKTDRLTSSSDDDNELPIPADGLEFECKEAMEHLRQAKHALPLIKYWDHNGWLPVFRATCYRKYTEYLAGKVPV